MGILIILIYSIHLRRTIRLRDLGPGLLDGMLAQCTPFIQGLFS